MIDESERGTGKEDMKDELERTEKKKGKQGRARG